MNQKTNDEYKDDLRREKTINYLNNQGFGNLIFRENLLNGAEFYKLNDDEINDAIKVFLETLNLASGSNTYFDFYSLLNKYIKEKNVRDKINEIIR